MMAATCFDILSKDIKGITPNEVDDLLKELQARQRKLVNDGVAVDEANQRASKSVQDDLKMAAAVERRSAAINLRVRLQQLDMIRTSFPDDVVQGLEAMMVGSKYSAEGSRYGADQIQEALKRKYVGGLVGDLQRAELLDVFASGTHDLDIARALRDLDTKSVTDKLPREAVAMAVIVRRWQEASRLDANRAGAWVGKLPDYILTQSHDQDRILNAGFDKWYRAIGPRLDIARMFPGASGPPDVPGFLRAAYEGLVTGIHENLGGAEKMAGFKGPGNLAKKQSQERKLHFKSADDWFEYNKEFGGGNLRESVVMGLSKLADATGLMRSLGTNPEANLATIVDTLRQELKDAGRFDELKKLDEWARGRGEGLYAIIAGRHRAAVNATGALVGTTVRGMQNITALGGAVLASISDPFVAANSATHEGRNLLGAFANQILAPVNAAMDKVSGGQRAAALRELNYFGDGITGGIGARFSMTEGVPGVMSKLQRWAFGLNLLRPWTDVGRGAALLGTSGHLAELTKLDFGKIGDDAQRMLARYGLTEKHWPLLREAVKESDRYTVMTPEALRAMDVRKFADLASARVDDVKSGMVGRIQKRMQQDRREYDWVRSRSEKLRDGIANALEKLRERLQKSDDKNKGVIEKLRRKLSDLDEQVEFAAGWWQERVDPSERVRFLGKKRLRTEGVTEGKALEAQKELRSQVREITRELSRLKKELNEDFVSRWQEKEGQFLAFAEGVDERIKARAEKTEQELVDLDPAIKRILEDQREDVATRLESLLYDRMNYAVISPTARTEYLQTAGGQQRGTIPGELARLVMQFKSFPIAFWQNAIQQELYGKGAKSMKQVGGREMLGIIRLMAMTTVAGYLSMTAKDWAKGKTARPTNSVHTWMAAAVQGGGLGIYGDFILGEANRFGQSAVETLAGPTLGDVADVVELLQSARDGDDPSAKAVRLLVNNTPFMNLFYVRMAMDHMFLYELQEQLNPGYLRRMEKRVERETGAKWMIRPSEALQ
jgi:hypothetical protein